MLNVRLLCSLLLLSCTCGLPEPQTKSLSRWKWEIWEDLPDENYLRIHLFNITNPDEFDNGEPPILEEVGPFVFKEIRDKISIIHSESSATASFKQILTYQFLPEQSIPRQDAVVNVINIPYVTFGKKLAEFFMGIHFKTLVSAGEKLVRRNEKIYDYIYGGVDAGPYLKVLEILSPGDIPPQFSDGKFDLFKGLNGTDIGELLVETGETPSSSYGKILQWKDKSKLDWWSGDSCNQISGTDGSVFDPKNMEKYDVKIFVPDLCRSLDYTFEGEQMFNGILGLKYTFRKDMLEDPRVNSNNKCFCLTHDEDNLDKCFKKGIMDISPCREGAPVAISYPHFLSADESYSEKIKGMKPDVELHESYMIVEPKTGTVLEDRKRFQLNMVVKPIPSIKALKNLPDLIFPVMWSDKTYTLDEASIAELKEELEKHKTDGPSWHSVARAGDPERKTNSATQTMSQKSGMLLLSALVLLMTKSLLSISAQSR